MNLNNSIKKLAVFVVILSVFFVFGADRAWGTGNKGENRERSKKPDDKTTIVNNPTFAPKLNISTKFNSNIEIENTNTSSSTFGATAQVGNVQSSSELRIGSPLVVIEERRQAISPGHAPMASPPSGQPVGSGPQEVRMTRVVEPNNEFAAQISAIKKTMDNLITDYNEIVAKVENAKKETPAAKKSVPSAAKKTDTTDQAKKAVRQVQAQPTMTGKEKADSAAAQKLAPKARVQTKKSAASSAAKPKPDAAAKNADPESENKLRSLRAGIINISEAITALIQAREKQQPQFVAMASRGLMNENPMLRPTRIKFGDAVRVAQSGGTDIMVYEAANFANGSLPADEDEIAIHYVGESRPNYPIDPSNLVATVIVDGKLPFHVAIAKASAELKKRGADDSLIAWFVYEEGQATNKGASGSLGGGGIVGAMNPVSLIGGIGGQYSESKQKIVHRLTVEASGFVHPDKVAKAKLRASTTGQNISLAQPAPPLEEYKGSDK